MLKTGMIIAERYEILAKIGTGGMADVYKAKDHKLNRFVAVKVLKPEFREDATFVQKFRSEAQAAAGLTHPNIVNVFDVGDDDGVYYIVMELIEGITLKEYITKKGKLSVKEATSIAIQVSMGLEAAHNHGIVHRDVKPQNIIISTDGKVKVTDFGIARAASSNTISSNVMGSVHYSSPEQVRGGYSDEKSDIYSLGITLYEMVTGRVPFDGDTTVAIAIKHLQEEMVPPSIYAEDLPYSLEQIILKCTQKSVGRRYDRMEEVIADLKHSLIDPQGDFVKIDTVDNEAKTVVISDEELGEIKHTPKQNNRSSQKNAGAADLEEETFDTNYDDYEEDDDEKYSGRRSSERKPRRKSDRSRNLGRIITIIALIFGAALLVVLIFFIGKAAGLMGGTGEENKTQQQQKIETNDEENNLAEVPNLLGKTEDEAAELLKAQNIGLQPMGEKASDQAKGLICEQDIPAGSMVEPYTTVKYYVSAGVQKVTVPDTDGRTGVEAQQILEDAGFTVNVEKVYSELDENGYCLVDPGYVYYTTPESGTTANAGDTITLVISRGVDYGDSVQVPDVIGWEENDAITILGKWTDIQIVEERNASVPEGEVISTNPEAYSYANPDEPIVVYISCGDKDPQPTAAPEQTADTQEVQDTQNAAADTQTTAPSADGTWKCTQRLDTPAGYQGGAVRLELLQTVNGQPTATLILENQVLTFPYQLDITGAPGISEGTVYLYEQVNGEYTELGHYTIEFKKVE